MGMAIASKIEHDTNTVIAVVGVGAFTGGMMFEALNNFKDSCLNVLIILNDTQIGIDTKTGAFNHNRTTNNKKDWIQRFGLD